jgi:DNA-binding XRE family transcriptional regulator
VNPKTTPAPSGEKIEALRWERRLTVPELAKKAGITRQYCKRICKGERGASLDVQQSLADALGVTVEEIQKDAP